MCGIAGWIGPRAGEAVAIRMADAIAHRGPDGSGVWTGPGVALSHRRLSIVDIAGGHQPMMSASGRWVLVFNGEIYNFRDLKQGALRDYPYRTYSDTEVILAALDRWGGNAVEHIDGMFGIAAWDRIEQRLLLARDGQGIKPLYYAKIADAMVFGSEIASLLAAGVRPAVDEDGLSVFLDLRFIPSPATLFQGVSRLAPGHRLWIEKDGHVGISEPFAFDAPSIDRTTSAAIFAERLHNTLVNSVKRQLVADVPIGILLSGGVDSAAVAAAAVRTGSSVSTFCIGYEDDHPSNEYSEARRTAQILGTDHHELHIDAALAADSMPKVIKHLEEPVVTTSMFSYYLLCQGVAKHRKVVLSGQGIDEPWAGYSRHRVAALSPVLAPLIRALPTRFPMRGNLTETWQRLQEALRPRDEIGRIIGLHTLFPGLDRSSIRPNDSNAFTYKAVENILGALPPNGTFLERLLAFETRTSLPDNLLLIGDKLSMASGLEVRVPMLDPAYLRLVETVPGDLRRAGFLAGNGKMLHKRVCESLLPLEVVHRRKKGFQSPIEVWLKRDLGARISDLVEDTRSFTRTYLEINTVRRIISDHKQGNRGNLERQLFAIWVLEEWHKVFFNL